MSRRRKPNSIRAMRELRRENRELRARLDRAWVIEHERELMYNLTLTDKTTDYIDCAHTLGYRVEIRRRYDDKLALYAIKRVDA